MARSFDCAVLRTASLRMAILRGNDPVPRGCGASKGDISIGDLAVEIVAGAPPPTPYRVVGERFLEGILQSTFWQVDSLII